MKWKKACAVVLIAVMACVQFSVLGAAFTDVNENYDWAIEAIDSFTEQEIIVGKGDGLFAPDDLVTREEVAKMLCLTFDLPLSKPDSPSFSDVSEDRWSYEYIESSKSYFVGETANYEPEKPATRGEITEAIVNILGLTAGDETEKEYAATVFSDLEGYPNLEKISLAVLYGLVEGYEDGTFRPDNNLTRAEAVVLLKRAQDAAAELATPSPSSTPAPTATAEPTAVPSGEPTASPTSLPTSVPQRPDDEQFAMVMSVTKALVDGEECYRLYYNMDGKAVEEPLVVRSDVRMTGMKQSTDSLSCGDIFLADYDVQGRATDICVLMSPGSDYPAQGEEAPDYFQKLLSAPSSAAWYIFGENNPRAIDEIYFGYIGEVKAVNGGISLAVLGADGDFSSDAAQYFFVPDSASVIRYIANSSLDAASRFTTLDAADIEVSDFPEDENGNIDFSSEDFRLKDMRYAFVHLCQGEVADVVLIDYSI